MSQWAENERWLSPEASVGLTKWRNRPYQVEPQDALNDPAIADVVAIWCSQSGKTELILNSLGYHIQHDPAPSLVVEPNLDMAKAFSKDRLAPMIRDTPALHGLVAEARARDSGNTTLHKSFAGGHVTMVGANSAAGLAMRPIRFLLGDEFANWPASAGSEGDPQKLATRRTVNFYNAERFWITSPRLAGGRDERMWKRSDQRRWYMPCPHCGREQYLRWEHVRWDKDEETGEHLPETARYECESCGEPWSEAERWRASARGHWKATAPFRGIAGFHLPAMSVIGRRLEGMVEEFVEAEGNPELLQVFINTVLAEWWTGGEDALDENDFQARALEIGWQQASQDFDIPRGGAVLTVGVDVQVDRLEYEVVAWGAGEESWSVHWGRIYGDWRKDRLGINAELDRMLTRAWRHELGFDLWIRGACIDTGYATQAAYRFCRPRLRRRLADGASQFVFAIKGSGDPGRPVWPDTSSQLRRTRKRGRRELPAVRLWIVGTNAAKDQVAGRLTIAEPGPGFCHFPVERPLAFFEQLASEFVETRRHAGGPVRVWVQKAGRANEAFDCRQYAYAALVGLSSEPFNLNLSREVARLEARKPEAQQAQRRVRRRRIRRSRRWS